MLVADGEYLSHIQETEKLWGLQINPKAEN